MLIAVRGHYLLQVIRIMMNALFRATFCLAMLIGCSRLPQEEIGRLTAETDDASTPKTVGATPRITNGFGMTFCLVTVDPANPKHEDDFPKQSFYLQQTELTFEQFQAFR